jgi:hypothetical protein
MHLCPITDHFGRSAGPAVIRRKRYILRGVLAGLLLLLASPALGADGETIFLRAPGLRLQKDPSVVIQATYAYANRHVPLPHYRDSAGNPVKGWSRKSIPTRRFKSDQSAWIYYRRQDLRHAVIAAHGWDGNKLCIWPGGTIIVIESYQDGDPARQAETPVEIAVISKANQNTPSYGKAFLAAEWSYARFTATGDAAMDGTAVRDCHQCHAIAFRLTGDLVFTHLP